MSEDSDNSFDSSDSQYIDDDQSFVRQFEKDEISQVQPEALETEPEAESNFAEPAIASALKWWGDFDLEIGEMGRWVVGPSRFTIHRLEQEWRIIHNQSEDPFDNNLSMEIPIPSDVYETGKSLRRYMFKETSSKLRLTPMLADRPIIVKPKTPFSIQEGQEVTLYVTTPIWIQVEVADLDDQGHHNRWQQLREISSHRPSDTWSGDAQAGELCYASPLFGRLTIDKVQRRPYRVVSPLRVRNHSKNPLLIESVKLPIQYLDLYAADDNFLWTQSAILDYERDRTRIRAGRVKAAEMGKGTLISPARQKAERGLADVFSRLSVRKSKQ